MQQSWTAGRPPERAKSISDLYAEQGILLPSPFTQDRSDISFAARLMTHWANLDKRQPSLRIVCRNYSEKPQPGLHSWDCPNLLWELMRTRTVKLTVLKYVMMSHPEPTVKTVRERVLEITQPLAVQHDLTSALIRHIQFMERQEEMPAPQVRQGGTWVPLSPRRWF